jgi:outer membrane protein assembly factor BamB
MMKCERGLQQIDQQRPRNMKQFANGSPAKPPILSATVKTALFAFVLFPTLSIADDWPHWLGPTRDFVWAENGIIQEMPESELKVLWRTPIGAGYSGPSVADGKVYATDYVKTSGKITNRASWKGPIAGYERIRCYDSETGELLWQHEAINGLNPETGSIDWSHPINATLRMSIMVPRKQGNLLYASTQKT